MERAAVTGIAFDKNQARINVRGVPDKPEDDEQEYGRADVDVAGRRRLGFKCGRVVSELGDDQRGHVNKDGSALHQHHDRTKTHDRGNGAKLVLGGFRVGVHG